MKEQDEPQSASVEDINPSIFAGIPKEMINVRIKDAKPLGKKTSYFNPENWSRVTVEELIRLQEQDKKEM